MVAVVVVVVVVAAAIQFHSATQQLFIGVVAQKNKCQIQHNFITIT